MTAPRSVTGPNWLVQLAAVIIVLAAVKAAASIVVPILLVIYLTILCAPLVKWLVGRGWNRGVAVALVVAAFLAIMLAVSAAVGNSLAQFIDQREFYQQRLTAWLKDLMERLDRLGVDTSAFDPGKFLDFGLVLQSAGSVLSNLGDVLSNTLLILMGVVFLLLDIPNLVVRLSKCPMPGGQSPDFSRLFNKINHYMALKAWLGFMTAASVTVGLKLMGVQFAILWGVLTFLLDFVPNIGSIIAAVPPTLLALVQLGPWSAVAVVALYLAVNMILGNIVEPRVIGRGLGLSSSVVLLSLVLWGWLLGPLGMLLAMPLTIAVKLVLESREDTLWMAAIMGDVEPASLPGGPEHASSRGKGKGH